MKEDKKVLSMSSQMFVNSLKAYLVQTFKLFDRVDRLLTASTVFAHFGNASQEMLIQELEASAGDWHTWRERLVIRRPRSANDSTANKWKANLG